jgi:hypothetical protein
MNDITLPIDISDSCGNSSGQDKKLFLELSQEMQCSYGAGSLMTVDNPGLTALCSETRGRILARISFGKRIQLLTASGLIAGITPLSVAKRSNQATLDFAFSWQDGESAE